MNCKPGDIAVIVKPYMTERNLGKLVVCEEYDPVEGWWVSALSPCFTVGGGSRTEGYVHDSRLKPLRDPGEDAVDEMVLLCGNPNENLDEAWEKAYRETYGDRT